MVKLKPSVIFSILFAWPSIKAINHLIIKINTLSVTPAGPHCASASKCLPLFLLYVSPGACEVVPKTQVAYFNHITRFRSVQVLAVADVYPRVMNAFFADAEKYLIARLKRIEIDRLVSTFH